MTLTTTTSRVSYPGTGSTGPFAFPFQILAGREADLLVTRRSSAGIETTLVLTTDYTVSGAGNATGTVTLVAALVVGDSIFIRRRPALTQSTSIRNQGAYFPATIEDEFDRLTMQLQSLQDQLDRSFKIAETLDASTFGMTLSDFTAGKVVTGTGTGFTMTTLDSSAVSLPGAGRTVATLSAYLANNSVFNPKDYGAVAGGATDATAALQAADAQGNVFLRVGVYRTASNLVLSRSITFESGAVLKPDAAKDISLVKPPLAGPVQIFDTSAAGSTITLATSGTSVVLEVYPQWWGAKADAATDDTAAVRAALLATPNGCILRLLGPYLVDGAGTEIFFSQYPISILGIGMASGFVLKSTMGATTDLFRFKPINAGSILNWKLADFTVTSQAATVGRHAINLDTDGANLAFSNLLIERIYCAYLLGYFLTTTRGAGQGVFSSTLRNLSLLAGIKLVGGGDNIHLENLNISGPTEGVWVDLVSGAGALSMIGVVTTTAKEGFRCDGATSLIITGCQFEQTVLNTSANNALVDLRGTSARIAGATLRGNIVRVLAGNGNPHGIRVDNCDNTSIDGGIISCITPGNHVQDTVNTIDTFVGPGVNLIGTGGGVVSNSGKTGRMYLQAGALKFKGGAGTITTLALA